MKLQAFAKKDSEKDSKTEAITIRLTVNNKKGFDNEIFIVKDPIMFRNEIQELMKHNAGIIREETRLQNGLKRILELKKEFYSKDNILKEFKIDDEEDCFNFGSKVIVSCL